MRSTVALTVLALVAGVVLGAILTYDSIPSQSLTSTNPPNAAALAAIRGIDARRDSASADDIIELEQRLQHEIGVRRALEQRVALLSRQVETLLRDSSLADGQAANPSRDDRSAAANTAPGRDWFDEQALIDNGIDRIQAGQLRAHFERLELERLALRNQSLREGWDRQQLRQALRDVALKENEIRDQFGEAAFDAYLFAAGLPNRVAVTSVLASAQAGAAGIQPGDYIMRYDNERIYDWFDLQEATAAGEAGEMVSLEVERDGETLQFYLQRGPLGIRMNSISVGPNDSR